MTSSPLESEPVRTSTTTYRIRVAGTLGEEWSGRAQGMAVAVHRSESGASFTELFGELPDEAALMGVLDALYTHGAHLLRVEQVEVDGPTLTQNRDGR